MRTAQIPASSLFAHSQCENMTRQVLFRPLDTGVIFIYISISKYRAIEIALSFRSAVASPRLIWNEVSLVCRNTITSPPRWSPTKPGGTRPTNKMATLMIFNWHLQHRHARKYVSPTIFQLSQRHASLHAQSTLDISSMPSRYVVKLPFFMIRLI